MMKGLRGYKVATVKIGKRIYNNIESIRLAGNMDCRVEMQCTDGTMVTEIIPGAAPILVEDEGNIKAVRSNNTAKVFGNVQIVWTGGLLEIEGSIKNSPYLDRVLLDYRVKVRTADQEKARYLKELDNKAKNTNKQFDKIFEAALLKSEYKEKEEKRKIIHVDGYLVRFDNSLINRQVDLEIYGNVESMDVSNYIGIKGTLLGVANRPSKIVVRRMT